MSTNLYTTDFFAWTQQQAVLIKAGKWKEIDLEHLAEEVEDMGKTEKRTLESRLEVLLMYLLKWQFQSAYRGKSWRLAIEVQRIRLAQHLRDNPSLKSVLQESINKSCKLAVIGAEMELIWTVFQKTALTAWSNFSILSIFQNKGIHDGYQPKIQR